MHQASEEPAFVKTVREIKGAEEEYDRLINSAKDKAAQIIRDARENAVQERTKAEEDVVFFKDSGLKKGSEEIEADVQKILEKTKEEGAKVSKKRIDGQAVTKMVKEFLSSS